MCRKCYDKWKYKDFLNKIVVGSKKYKNYLERKRQLIKKRKGHDVIVEYKIARAGEGTITSQGYRRLPGKGHPNSQKASGCILEHVLVMSNYLGRPLRKGETVHHKNGNRLDNRIENLELFSSNHGPGQRVKDLYKWCMDFIQNYEKEIDKL